MKYVCKACETSKEADETPKCENCGAEMEPAEAEESTESTEESSEAVDEAVDEAEKADLEE